MPGTERNQLRNRGLNPIRVDLLNESTQFVVEFTHWPYRPAADRRGVGRRSARHDRRHDCGGGRGGQERAAAWAFAAYSMIVLHGPTQRWIAGEVKPLPSI